MSEATDWSRCKCGEWAEHGECLVCGEARQQQRKYGESVDIDRLDFEHEAAKQWGEFARRWGLPLKDD